MRDYVSEYQTLQQIEFAINAKLIPAGVGLLYTYTLDDIIGLPEVDR